MTRALQRLRHRGLRLWLVALALWLGTVPAHAASSMESALSPGVLTQAHAKWDDSCRSCHTPFDRKDQDRLCADCHKDIGRDLSARTGLHGRMKAGQTCRSCHTEHKGRDMRIAPLDTKAFDHTQTDYALRGKHRDTECAKCHVPGRKYSATPQDCNSCHRKDDVHKASLGVKCDSCHDERSWRDTRFDHSTTRFALLGAHDTVKCESCHRTREYKDTPRDCIGCHRKDDKHKTQFGEKCESCHSERRWRDISFRHDVDTRYPLRDKHRDVKCTSCHSGSLYRDKLDTTCITCHRKDDKHKTTLGTECSSCHSERGWREVRRFDHDRTAFPLLGRHIKTDCKSCHQSLVYREAPSTCIGCHKKDDKHQGHLGERCADCHTETDWVARRFDHAQTQFPLRGAHAATSLKCDSCHRDLRSYRGTPTTCVNCHRKDDKHEGQLGDRCQSCHGESNWTVARYDHSRARFALTGAHQSTDCKSCHASRRFRDAPRTCIGCHVKDDKHKARFGTACESCHGTRSWKTWRFDHDRETRYPLIGRHLRAACESCHTQPAGVDKRSAPLETTCISCHARDDVHERSFGLRCDQCHQPSGWRDLDTRRHPRSAGAS